MSFEAFIANLFIYFTHCANIFNQIRNIFKDEEDIRCDIN